MPLGILLNTPHPTIIIIEFFRLALPCTTIAYAVAVLIVIPQLRLKQHNAQKYTDLKVGQPITTISGDNGIILEIWDNIITIQHADGRKIEITKQAIAPTNHGNS